MKLALESVKFMHSVMFDRRPREGLVAADCAELMLDGPAVVATSRPGDKEPTTLLVPLHNVRQMQAAKVEPKAAKK